MGGRVGFRSVVCICQAQHLIKPVDYHDAVDIMGKSRKLPIERFEGGEKRKSLSQTP